MSSTNVSTMHVLEQAREAVRRDLSDPHKDDLVDRCVEHRRWWVEQWEDGAPFLLCLLAQDVQEAVHEEQPPSGCASAPGSRWRRWAR